MRHAQMETSLLSWIHAIFIFHLLQFSSKQQHRKAFCLDHRLSSLNLKNVFLDYYLPISSTCIVNKMSQTRMETTCFIADYIRYVLTTIPFPSSISSTRRFLELTSSLYELGRVDGPPYRSTNVSKSSSFSRRSSYNTDELSSCNTFTNTFCVGSFVAFCSMEEQTRRSRLVSTACSKS